jgi:hypothetical protein
MRDFAGDETLLSDFTTLSRNLTEEVMDLKILEERVQKNYAVVVYVAPASAGGGRDSLQLLRESGAWRLALGKPE